MKMLQQCVAAELFWLLRKQVNKNGIFYDS